MFLIADHPEIQYIERTGYPSYLQPEDELDDEDDDGDSYQ